MMMIICIWMFWIFSFENYIRVPKKKLEALNTSLKYIIYKYLLVILPDFIFLDI